MLKKIEINFFAEADIPVHMCCGGIARNVGSVISEKENDQKDSYAKDVFELPPELANPQKAPCVNVPEWFVKEGGELCLSDTANGLSIIR